MQSDEFFDVLSIRDENGNVDMIQALMGSDCLGSYYNKGTAKLYFQGGLKNQLEIRLKEINVDIPFKWKWKKQNKEDWHLSWQDNFQPVIINEKMVIIPHWKEDRPEDVVIKLKRDGIWYGSS